MKKKISFFVLTAAIAAFTLSYIFSGDQMERAHYEHFILKKAAYLDLTVKQGTDEGLMSADKPDEAAFQEYITTVDPELGHVPKSRLWKAYKYTTEKMDEQRALNRYDPLIEWEQTGANMGGRTRMIMFDPNDQNNKKVWAGGVTGGLWYTNDITDTEEQWIPAGDFWSNLDISCMGYDLNNTSTYYIGTGEAQTARIIYRESSGLGAGLFRSTDAGDQIRKLGQ